MTLLFDTVPGRRYHLKLENDFDCSETAFDWLDTCAAELEWELERMRFENWLISKELPPVDS